jgi:hypothetical protein
VIERSQFSTVSTGLVTDSRESLLAANHRPERLEQCDFGADVCLNRSIGERTVRPVYSKNGNRSKVTEKGTFVPECHLKRRVSASFIHHKPSVESEDFDLSMHRLIAGDSLFFSFCQLFVTVSGISRVDLPGPLKNVDRNCLPCPLI